MDFEEDDTWDEDRQFIFNDGYPQPALPKMRRALEFIQMVNEATLVSQFDVEELAELLQPWNYVSAPPDDPDLKLSLLNYISFIGFPQSAYEAARQNIHQCHPEIELLSHYRVD